MAFPDHYAALGIDPTADQEVITAAYRALAKKYHPDTGATTGTASAERFAEIQQAYEVLGSAERRRAYDVELLEATQRELDEHLAAKQRKLTARAGVAEPTPAPDLGVFRPERRPGPGPKWNGLAGLRDMGPFLVVSGLLLVVVGGLSALFLSSASVPPLEPPALPESPPAVEAALPTASSTSAASKARQQQAAAPAPQQVEATPPLFGTSMMDEELAAGPAPGEEATAAAPIDAAPVETAPAESAAPAPVPKARPRMETAAASLTEQPAAEPSRVPRFTLVIYERGRDGDTRAEEARVAFISEDRCSEFGEKAVLRRLAPYEGDTLRPRIWYECQPAE